MNRHDEEASHLSEVDLIEKKIRNAHAILVAYTASMNRERAEQARDELTEALSMIDSAKAGSMINVYAASDDQADTAAPTAAPTEAPSAPPTEAPTEPPTPAPTPAPTEAPPAKTKAKAPR